MHEASPSPPGTSPSLFAQIVDVLVNIYPHEAGAEQAADLLVRNEGDPQLISDMIFNLTTYRTEGDRIEDVWQGILEHQSTLTKALGRDPGLRVAALDYVGNVLRIPAEVPVVHPDILEHLYREATSDPLTGLKNRRLFQSRMDEEVSRAKRYGGHFALALFDLDDFKQVNDRHGHKAGDQVLRALASSIRQSIRESDVAARWGGEEFAVLMPETNRRAGMTVANRIRHGLAEACGELGTTLSGGVAAFPQDGESCDAVFRAADHALYRAKKDGKDRVCVAENERRSDPRRPCAWPVSFRLADRPSQTMLEAETTNVSLGGMGFGLDRELDASTPIEGVVMARQRPLAFVGEIAHVRRKNEGPVEVGVCFSDVAPEWRTSLPPAETRAL